MTKPNFADKTIWTGDNLDIMRGMNSESVDLIYLDPPFNSNQNYAAPIPYRRNDHVLFGQQEGVCNGCRTEFPFRNLEVDHVIPQSRGGTDHIENLQLLCPSCDRIKGYRPQEYLGGKVGGDWWLTDACELLKILLDGGVTK